MAQKLPAIEALQTCGYFPPEPLIVLEISLYKLPDVFRGVAMRLSGHASDLRFHIRAEADFHDLRVGNARVSVKRVVPNSLSH